MIKYLITRIETEKEKELNPALNITGIEMNIIWAANECWNTVSQFRYFENFVFSEG